MSEAKTSKAVMISLSIMLFLQFWIWGSWYISIPEYLKATTYVNFGGNPWYCYSAVPLAAMIAPFFLGLFADRFFNTEKLLFILFGLAGAFMLLIPAVGSINEGQVIANGEGKAAYETLKITFLGISCLKHEYINNLIFAHTLCYMPTLALTASLSFQHLKKGSSEFPLVRLWGTFGWIFAGLVIPFFSYTTTDAAGEILRVGGESTAGQFHLGGWACLVLAIFCLFLPKTPAPKKGEKINLADLLFLDVWKEFRKPSFFVFVACSLALCIPLQAYYAYLQNQMKATNIENYTVWKNLGTWVEAGLMFAMPFFFRKLGVKKMIAFGIAAWIFRYAMFPLAAQYGVIPEGTSQFGHMGFIFLMLGVIVHGFCYDFFFVTGQIYVDQATDPKARAQAQSMMIFFTQGLGMYIGAMLNESLRAKTFVTKEGVAVDNSSAASLAYWPDFWWPLCIASTVILVIFLVAFKHKDKEGAELSH